MRRMPLAPTRPVTNDTAGTLISAMRSTRPVSAYQPSMTAHSSARSPAYKGGT